MIAVGPSFGTASAEKTTRFALNRDAHTASATQNTITIKSSILRFI